MSARDGEGASAVAGTWLEDVGQQRLVADDALKKRLQVTSNHFSEIGEVDLSNRVVFGGIDGGIYSCSQLAAVVAGTKLCG